MVPNKKGKNIVWSILCFFIIFLLHVTSHAYDNDTYPLIAPSYMSVSAADGGGEGVVRGSGALEPDLFTGTMSNRIAIEVPKGRHDMQPNLVLVYRSNKGNGIMGVGWDLEGVSAIERNARNGIDYSGEEFVLRKDGAAIELANINGDYHAKIEGEFNRIKKLPAENGRFYWEVTDNKGVRYLYGQTEAERQYDPENADRMFKWCLNQVIDTNGNYMTFSYFKDSGQIYLDRIDYTGNIDGTGTTNYVKLYWESRTDAPDMYLIDFKVKTAYRLMTIDIVATADNHRVRSYKLSYDTAHDNTQYSAGTGRSLLTRVQQYGKDAELSDGVITRGKALPAMTFTWQDDVTNFQQSQPTWSGPAPDYEFLFDPQLNFSLFLGVDWECLTGDLNGDGRTDFWCNTLHDGSWSKGGLWSVGLSTGSSWLLSNVPGPAVDTSVCMTGDLNGDGRTDFWCETGNGTGVWSVAISTGSSWTLSTRTGPAPSSPIGDRCMTGDLNRDGKSDFWCQTGDRTGSWTVAIATDDNWLLETWSGPAPGVLPSQCLEGDLDGDGRTDFWCADSVFSGNTWTAAISTGSGWDLSTWNGPVPTKAWLAYLCITGDLNGDGKTDFWCETDFGTGLWDVWLSTGSDWTISPQWSGPAPQYWYNPAVGFSAVSNVCLKGDLNGDGKTDFWCLTGSGAAPWDAALSTGSGWSRLSLSGPGNPRFINKSCLSGDVNGDNKTDFWCETSDNSGSWTMALSPGHFSDSITRFTNGIGSKTEVAYKSSTAYSNTQLPFPIQTVSSITTDDGNGVISTVTYTYSGGFYHMEERDFRGFSYANITGPAGPDGEQKVTETWFHQGTNESPSPDRLCEQYAYCKPCAPDVYCYCPCAKPGLLDSVGYMKGKPYRTKISDTSGKTYNETIITYATDADYVMPYFNPPLQVDTYIDSTQHIQTIYSYDHGNGNILREDQYGDVNDPTDDRTVIRTFSPNTSAWILDRPATETIYQGTGSNLTQVALTSYYYDESTDCTFAPLNPVNLPPSKGNLTRIVRWLDGVNDPEERMAYIDSTGKNYGNLICTRDANGNVSRTDYDQTTQTLPTIVTNALGHQTITQYYNGILTDNGLYGQVKSTSDSNLPANTTTTEYDKYGRKTKVIAPDESWTSWGYNNFGEIDLQNRDNSQNVMVDNSEGLTSWTYFDGLGRTIFEKKDGPDNEFIITKTVYNNNGTVNRKSYPYFESSESQQRYKEFKYDALGRTLETKYPDFTNVKTCYDKGVTVNIDENGQRKRATKDALGRLVLVEEYMGKYTSCTTDPGTPYATTIYAFDVLGNLRFLTDAAGNQTEMRYDSLGRKRFMHDPDMGEWTYTYYPNGKLETQQDAKGHTITFLYDPLNRITYKDYPTAGTHVVSYKYDESWSENAMGRLTTMSDASGTTKYYYDPIGRNKKITKQVDRDYTTQYTYDGLGRLKTITYPIDGDIVRYTYDSGGNLWEVINDSDNTRYATWTGYNPLGQVGNVAYKNGVTTDYTYHLSNNWLSTILTSKGSQNLFDIAYFYDNVGNVTNITDNTPRSQSAPQFDEIATYEYNTNHYQPHAVQRTSGGNSFIYDANGNMTFDGIRQIVYDQDNKPQSITMNGVTTTFVYDGNGARVKKITPDGTTIYIDKYLECKNGTCAKYIFAGKTRIAQKISGAANIVYYHQDNLDSTSVVSNASGNKEEDIQYLPFGEIRLDFGSVSMSHKYTSKELDTETGLYFYEARYYNPVLGKFISPDTIIPDYSNPQSLNRYSYVLNNPLKYVDPTGHTNAETGGYYDVFGTSNWQTGYWFLDNTVMPVLNEANNLSGYVGNSFLNGLGYGLGLAYDAENFVLRDVLGGSQADVEAFNVFVGVAGAGGFSQFGTALRTANTAIRTDGILANEVGGIGRAAKGAESFFEGTRYSDKVLTQMKAGAGEFHSFPETVRVFENVGTIRAVRGGDGIVRQTLEIPGSYCTSGPGGVWYDGAFQFMKEADGTINHRLFVPN